MSVVLLLHLSLDQERRTSPDSAFFSTAPLNSNASDRHPVKPRAMTQIPIPADHFDEEEVYFLHGSSDGDLTLARERKIFTM